MSVAILTQSEDFDRRLEYARERVLPGIVQNAIDAKPLLSLLVGQMANPEAGMPMGVGMGRSRRTLTGSSIEQKVRLGTNLTFRALGGGYDTFDTTPSDTVRHGRANWKFYGGTVNLSEHEIQAQNSEDGFADIVDAEMRDGTMSLVDRMSTALFSNSDPNELTPLQSIVGASNSVFGLNGASYPRWNSRGISARGTAPASVSFTGGSFSITGIANWLKAWSNAEEGTIKPTVTVTTHDIKNFYEGSLQPLERIQNMRLGDGGFQQLQWKTSPVFADPDCPSGETYFLNLDFIWMNVLAGADFQSGPFIQPVNQRVRIAKVFATVEMMVSSRLYQNKVTGQTA